MAARRGNGQPALTNSRLPTSSAAVTSSKTSGCILQPSTSSSSTSVSSSSSNVLQSKSMPSILGRKRKSDVLEEENDMNIANYLQPAGSRFGRQPDGGPAPKAFNSGLGNISASSSSSENRPPLASLQNTFNISHNSHNNVNKSVLAPSQKAAQPASSSRVPFSALQPHNPRLQQQNQPSDNGARAFGRPLNNSLANISISRPQHQQQHQQLQQRPRQQLHAKVIHSREEETSVRVLPPSPKRLKLRQSWSTFREYIISTPAGPSRCETPFPALKWANPQEMWDLICKKERGMYKRKTGAEILQRHSAVQPRMRAILLDWLIEVCEVYRLHRETFYLAVDYIDRYLSSTSDLPKTRLQLIGVTCLFIAAKIEEIYPPKVADFAYVTDGACAEEEILKMELCVLKSLNWGLSPMTPNSWVKLFMQVSNCDQGPRASENFVVPQFSGLPFARCMQLLDLAILDLSSLDFAYSVMAASAVAILQSMDLATAASGYSEAELAGCVRWLRAFHLAMREERAPAPRTFSNIAVENQHNIQAHTNELTVLDRAQELLEETRAAQSASSSSAAASGAVEGVLDTPPVGNGDVELIPIQAFPGAFTPEKKSQINPATSSSTVFLSPETPVTSRMALTSRTAIPFSRKEMIENDFLLK